MLPAGTEISHLNEYEYCPRYIKTIYLDLKLVALSTTYTTKLPPVLAHPVYHPHVKAKPFGCSTSLRSLDMGWCVEPGPHRKGTRSRRCGRRLTEKQGGKLTSSRRGTWGPLRRLQLTCSELIIHFRQSDLELLLELSVFCFQFFDATIFGENDQITTRICFP